MRNGKDDGEKINLDYKLSLKMHLRSKLYQYNFDFPTFTSSAYASKYNNISAPQSTLTQSLYKLVRDF